MRVRSTKGVLFLLLALVLAATALAPAPALANPPSPFGTLYVATANDQSVVAIDLASGAVVNEIPLAAAPPPPLTYTPHGLAMAPGGQRLYVANMLASATTIKVIDTATAQVVDELPVGVRSHHIQLSRQGGRELYIAPGAGSLFYIYDLVTGTTTALPVGAGPTDVGVSPNGRTAVVASTGGGGSVTVVDLLKKMAGPPMALPPREGFVPRADHVTFSPNGKLAYVVDNGANRLLALDLSTLTWVGSAIVGAAPHGVAVTHDGQKVYVGNRGTPSIPSDTISVIDAQTFTVVNTIVVGVQPDHFTMDVSGHFLFIPIRSTKVMKVLDTSTDQVVGEIPVGRDLHVSVQGHN